MLNEPRKWVIEFVSSVDDRLVEVLVEILTDVATCLAILIGPPMVEKKKNPAPFISSGSGSLLAPIYLSDHMIVYHHRFPRSYVVLLHNYHYITGNYNQLLGGWQPF